MTKPTESYGSIDTDTEVNIRTLPHRMLSIDFKRFSTFQRTNRHHDLKNKTIYDGNGTYKTLNFKMSEQTRDTKQNSEEYPNNSSNSTLGNAIITLFHALKQFNKDEKNGIDFRISEPSEKKQKSLIDSINCISISTIDLILAISQPRKNLDSMVDIIESFLESQAALERQAAEKGKKHTHLFTLKRLFPFIDEKENVIVEIVRVKNFDTTIREIIIHTTPNLSLDVTNKIKNLAKKNNYEFYLDKSLPPHEFQSDQRLLNIYYWIKNWIAEKNPDVVIKPKCNELHSSNIPPDKTISNEIKKNIAAYQGHELSCSIKSAVAEIPWGKNTEAIILNSEKDIIPFLTSLCSTLEALKPITKTTSEKSSGLFKLFRKNGYKDSTIPDIIRKSPLFDASEEPSFVALEKLFSLLGKASKEKINSCYRPIYKKYEDTHNSAQLRLATQHSFFFGKTKATPNSTTIAPELQNHSTLECN